MNNGRKPPQSETFRAVTDGQVAGLRLLLGTTTLAARLFGVAENGDSFDLGLAILFAYILYNAVSFALARRFAVFSSATHMTLVFIDLAVYTMLTMFPGARDVPTFPFLFLVVVIAYTQRGMVAGLGVTILGLTAFLSLTYLGENSLSSTRVIFRSAFLVAAAAALAYWARAEQILRRKLDVLRDLSIASNPRFGMNRMTSHVMERVLKFFPADVCVLIGYVGNDNDYVLRTASKHTESLGAEGTGSPELLRDLLQRVLRSRVGIYTERKSFWRRTPVSLSWDPVDPTEVTNLPVHVVATIAEWLHSRSLIAVPLRHHEWTRGFILIGAKHPCAFGIEEAQFLLQIADQVTPVFEHVRVIDRMASDAAEDERRRIGRSIHDRVIQPYIGLQIGLHGFRRILQTSLTDKDTRALPFRDALVSVDYLVTRASAGLEDLRDCVYDLRNDKHSGDPLLSSLRRYADKFNAVTGIQVTVTSQLAKGAVTDRLAAEILQTAIETLNGLHRHTTVTSVELKIERMSDGAVVVRTTEHPDQKTLLERSNSPVEASNGINVHTVVNVKLPL
jgi:signal transduction histidine kinase